MPPHHPFFKVPPFCCIPRIMQYKKMLTTMVTMWWPKLTEHCGLENSGVTPSPLGTIKARCPDHPIAQQPLPFEKHTHIHPNSWNVQISQFGCTGKKCRAISSSGTSGISLPYPQSKGKGRGWLRWWKKMNQLDNSIFISNFTNILTCCCCPHCFK